GGGRAVAWLVAAMLLLGHVLARISKPAKINWLMSLVPDGRRGVFSANKEIVSLLIGMAFTAAMSRIIDGYEAVGNLNKAYIFIGVTILLLTLLHTLSLIFAKEKTVPEDDKPEKHSVLGMLSDKNICAVLAIYVLWGVVSSISRPFYGSYEIDELGFSMTFASLLVILGSFARMLFSRPMGKLGDKKGFLTMLASGLLLETASLVTAAFSTPQNGRILFTASMILHYTAMAGINSGLVNSIFDYAKPAARTGAIALADFLSGVFGFGVTAAVSPAVNAIQESGNTVLGHSIFAQQLLSAVAAVCCMGMIVFILIMKKKLNRPVIR
ncbi:MAG: MFS transporter, partial [Clostridia bacterium]|nr:MFS transporter [Clostridia bacterium]